MRKIEVKEVTAFIVQKLDERIKSAGLSVNDVKSDFDLVKNGLLDSLSFVDFVMVLEQHYNIEIDFENAFQHNSFTTLSGLAHQITKSVNG